MHTQHNKQKGVPRCEVSIAAIARDDGAGGGPAATVVEHVRHNLCLAVWADTVMRRLDPSGWACWRDTRVVEGKYIQRLRV